jgi:hypothetical protein
MASYYEALPIYKAAMDVAVRVDAVVQRWRRPNRHPCPGTSRQAAPSRLSF